MKTYTKLLLTLIGSLSLVNVDKIYGMKRELPEQFARLTINPSLEEEKNPEEENKVTFRLSKSLIQRIKTHRPTKMIKRKKGEFFTFFSRPQIQYFTPDDDVITKSMMALDSKEGIRVSTTVSNNIIIINIPVYHDASNGELTGFSFDADSLVPGTTYFINLAYEQDEEGTKHAICQLVPADGSATDVVVTAESPLEPNLAVI
jgi:hypothetical protein